MLAQLKRLREENPILLLTLIAFTPRLLSAIFSQGFFAFDDHFLVIEAAQSWVDGKDYNYWLPWNQQGEPEALGHNFFFPGLVFLLFGFLDVIGSQNPDVNLFVVRLLLAIWSLVIVRCAYRIALSLSGNEKTAWWSGLLAALYFFMPYLSVRTLPEVVCIPLIMLAAERVIRGKNLAAFVWAGIFIGIAANIRLQVLAFGFGIGVVMLFTKPIKHSIAFGILSLLPLVLFQGGIDMMIWGKPFVEIQAYINHNLEHTHNYIVHPWYQYLILIPAVLIPPFSLFLLRGLFPVVKKALPVFVGVLVFIAVHSMIVNKQERFILPILPLLITLGITGLFDFLRTASPFWQKAYKGSALFAGVLSFLVMIPLCFSYGKRSRAEIMSRLRPEVSKTTNLIIENSHFGEDMLLPQYYADSWDFSQWQVSSAAQLAGYLENANPQDVPNYAVFVTEERLDERVAAIKELIPGKYVQIGKEGPGLLDRTLHWLNPLNRNEIILLYRIERD